MRYDDFVIHLEPEAGHGYRSRVLQSPAGEGQSHFELPFDSDELDRVLNVIDQRSGPSRRDVSPTASRALVTPAQAQSFDPADLGHRLFDSLFSGQVGTLYHQSLGILGSDAERGLRIKLKLQSTDVRVAELERLPWEMLCRSETRDYLSLSRITPVVRYLDVPRPIQPIPLAGPLRILVLISSPAGLPPLDLEAEKRDLEEIWKRQSSVEPVFLEKATVGAMRDALFEQPVHAIHFMGHGGFDNRTGEGVLYFEDEEGVAEALSGRDLATKLKDFKSLGLLFLNACETARASGTGEPSPYSGVASALVLGGMPAVVAMQFPISDKAAIRLSGAFYHRMTTGIPVDEALTEGRQAIHTALPDSIEWATPVLFARVPDGKVFKPASEKRSPAPRALFVVLPVLLLLLGFSAFQMTRETFSASPAIEIQCDLEGLDGFVTDVEMLPNGRMRVKFKFVNQTEDPQKVGFDLNSTYLADDLGNRYSVAGAGREDSSKLVGFINPGEAQEHEIEFDAPQYAPKKVKFNLASADPAGPSFRLVDIPLKGPGFEDLPKTPPPTEAPPASPGFQRLEPADAELVSEMERVESRVAYVDHHPDGRMRWKLEVFNKSERAIEIDYAETYIVDDLGKEYYPYGGGGSEPWTVYRALREEYAIEFNAPQGAARNFRLVLATRTGTMKSKSKIQIEGEKEKKPDQSFAETDQAPDPGLLPKAVGIGNNLEGLDVQLRRIEARGDGSMRWSFEFSNSANRRIGSGLELPGIYLADESGRRFAVLDSDGGHDVSRDPVGGDLEPGQRVLSWLEFEAPFEGSETFWVFLASHDAQLAYDPTSVGPLRFPENFAQPSRRESGPPDSLNLEIGQSVTSNREELECTLIRVVLLKKGRMRWYLNFLNRSVADTTISLDFGEIRLEDEYANPYNVVAANIDTGSGGLSEELPGRIRARHWIEFLAPLDGARRFRLALAGLAGLGLEFEELEVGELPEYPPEYGKKTVFAEPVKNLEVHAGQPLMETDVDGVHARLTSLGRLGNGRVRWSFDFVNESSKTVVIGFDHQGTYLSDDNGHTYKLLQADTNPNPAAVEKDYRGPLPAGTQVSHWFEFSGPVNGARAFYISIKSHDTDIIRFQPLKAELPD